METVEILAIIEISEIIHKRLEDDRQLTKDKAKDLYFLLRSRFKGNELQEMEKAYQYLGWELKFLHDEKGKSI